MQGRLKANHLIEQVISILQGLLDNGLKVDQAI